MYQPLQYSAICTCTVPQYSTVHIYIYIHMYQPLQYSAICTCTVPQ